MKYIHLLISQFVFCLIVHAQSPNCYGYGCSGDCQVNVFDTRLVDSRHFNIPWRKPVIDATFTFENIGCTGTLLNRNVGDSELGYYFVTANHCVDDKQPGEEINEYLVFNFQSTNFSNSIDNSNKGQARDALGLPIPSTSQNGNAFQYVHKTKIKIVDRFFWGDFALMQIMDPLPEHFDFTFAGWSPSRFHLALPNSPIYPSTYAVIHHPKVDIKKITGMTGILWLETPLATGCYTITAIIDAVIGFFGGNVSTQQICSYVDNPWLEGVGLQYGSGDYGSSGSSIFNPTNQTLGVCTFLTNSCAFPYAPITFGKLASNYSKPNVKNTLNPSNDLWTNLWGMSPRKITCRENLTLPYILSGNTFGPGQNIAYFPANQHQAENRVILSARNTITTNNYQVNKILSGGEYVFNAGQSIELNPGFEVEAGANFEAILNGCIAGKSAEATTKGSISESLSKIYIPEHLEEPKHNVSFTLTAAPNPFNEAGVRIDFGLEQAGRCMVTVHDVLGKQVAVLLSTDTAAEGPQQLYWDAAGAPVGIYIVTLHTEQGRQSIKVSKQ